MRFSARNKLLSTSLLCALLWVVLLLPAKGGSAFSWQTTQAGFGGTIRFKSDESPPGGGSLADIDFAYIQTPSGKFYLDFETAQSIQALTWNTNGIVNMDIAWVHYVPHAPDTYKGQYNLRTAQQANPGNTYIHSHFE